MRDEENAEWYRSFNVGDRVQWRGQPGQVGTVVDTRVEGNPIIAVTIYTVHFDGDDEPTAELNAPQLELATGTA